MQLVFVKDSLISGYSAQKLTTDLKLDDCLQRHCGSCVWPCALQKH